MNGIVLFTAKILVAIAAVFIGQTICYAMGRKALAKMTLLVGILLGASVLLQGINDLQVWINQKTAPVKNAVEKVDKFNQRLDSLIGK